MRYRVPGDRPPARRCALRRARRCAWLTAPARGRALFGAASSLQVSPRGEVMPQQSDAAMSAATRSRRRWHWTSMAAVAGGGLLVVGVQAVEGGALRPLFQLP